MKLHGALSLIVQSSPNFVGISFEGPGTFSFAASAVRAASLVAVDNIAASIPCLSERE